MICRAGDRSTSDDQCVLDATHRVRLSSVGDDTSLFEAELCEPHAENAGELAKAFSLAIDVKEIA
jgi:hypothetical protein